MMVGLDALLEEGRLRAIALKRPVLVSRSRPVPDPADPVSLFAGADAEEPWRVFWCQPSRGEWIVGIGAASILRGSGDRRFVQTKEGLRSLMTDALVEAPGIRGVGPLALGGFRFDPSARVSEEWRGYGDGFLVLPRVCYAGNKEGTWITENLVIHPDGFDKGASSDIVTVGADGGQSGKSSDDVESEAVARKRWRRSVDRVLKAIRAGEVEKVVLARRVMARNLPSLSIERVLSRLIDIDPECTVFALAGNGTTFLGATPEPVLKVSGTKVECVCEAGSAPRGSTLSEDRRLGEALLADAKERREHSLVVNAVAESLNGLCTNLQWQETPEILKLRNVQHLSTTFHGLNTRRYHALDFVEHLHPTPAVSGVPRDKAVRLIGEIEEMDRGWYGGLVGWIDASGQGEFTIALRSALLQSHTATLYAGAGIVEGSDPDREYAETGFKLQTMMSALELEG